MTERTALGEAILKHWREHLPRMVSTLEKHNRLEQTVLEAQDLTGDLLYELVSVKKMDYQAAWEMATREWGFLPEEARPPRNPSAKSSPTRSRQPRRGTSASRTRTGSAKGG